MTAARDELHQLIDELPDDQITAAAADLRQRIAKPRSTGTWPPVFFGSITDAPADLASNVDKYLEEYGFGSDRR